MLKEFRKKRAFKTALYASEINKVILNMPFRVVHVLSSLATPAVNRTPITIPGPQMTNCAIEHTEQSLIYLFFKQLDLPLTQIECSVLQVQGSFVLYFAYVHFL